MYKNINPVDPRPQNQIYRAHKENAIDTIYKIAECNSIVILSHIVIILNKNTV
jgi:hypothetical protein